MESVTIEVKDLTDDADAQLDDALADAVLAQLNCDDWPFV